MERITLSRNAKRVMLHLRDGGTSCPAAMIQADFNSGAKELWQHGFVITHEEENGNVEIARLADKGKIYLADNPALHNPIDTKWLITTAIALASAIASTLVLIVACNKF